MVLLQGKHGIKKYNGCFHVYWAKCLLGRESGDYDHFRTEDLSRAITKCTFCDNNLKTSAG